MKKKTKFRRKEREVLEPINRDARAFLRKWGTCGEAPLSRGPFLCKSCGADFDNQLSLACHCKAVHKEIYSSEFGGDGNSLHIRCRICGAEMLNTPMARKDHMTLHETKEMIDFCKLNEVSNPFEEF